MRMWSGQKRFAYGRKHSTVAIINGGVPHNRTEIPSLSNVFAVSLIKLLKKEPGGWWNEMQQRSWNVTLMFILCDIYKTLNVSFR